MYYSIAGGALAVVLILVGVISILSVDRQVNITVKNAPPEFSEEVLGGDNYAVDIAYLAQNDPTLAYNATSTPQQYLTAGAASTTMVFNCENASQIDLNLATTASSTAAKYQWEVAFATDNLSAASGLWHYEDAKTVDSRISVTHGAGPATHYWTPASTSETTKNITITPTASKFCRVDFAVSGANGGLWASAVKKGTY